MFTGRLPTAIRQSDVEGYASSVPVDHGPEHVVPEHVAPEHVENVLHVFMAALLALLIASAPSPAVAESKPDAKSLDAKTLSERQAQIVKMSQVERDHLQRNLAAFQQMSPEKRDQYRQLNAELEENKRTGGPLSSLLQTYSAWLQTLTPSQREALRLETDSAKKLALVQKFKDEQYSRMETFAGDPEVPVGRQLFGLKLLAPSELNNVMKILVAELPAEDQAKLGKVHRPEQYPEILNRSVHRAADGPRTWPSGALQENILNALPAQVRTVVKRNPNGQRERIAGFLFMSVIFLAEESRPKFPKDGDLKQFLSEMDAKQRSMLEQLPPEEMKGELIHRYFEQHERRLQELRSGLGRLKAEVGLPAPPFPGNFPRPGDRGAGDRGPDDRMGPDRFGPGRDNPRPERPPPRRDGKENGPRKPND